MPKKGQGEKIENLNLRLAFITHGLNGVLYGIEKAAGSAVCKAMMRQGLGKTATSMAKILSEHYGIKKWTPKTYCNVYVKKYLDALGAKPELVKKTKQEIIFRQHACPLEEFAKHERLFCDFCSLAESKMAQELIDAKETKLTQTFMEDKYCEFQIKLK